MMAIISISGLISDIYVLGDRVRGQVICPTPPSGVQHLAYNPSASQIALCADNEAVIMSLQVLCL